ncbi:MAG: amidase [Deltaproteobacteria bacterium]|nr:MAG: amidase [Deltaproteobacteria bacterium]
MKLPEYESWDATAMAEAVRKGKVSPAELLEASIERIEARNPTLNAVVYKMYDRARANVDKLPDGPLKGVPFLVKDLKLRIDGTPTSDGSKLSLGVPRQGTSELARRYEAAGLQILGKTNTPEFGIMGITEPSVYGPCRNPHNPDHTPGGSSGGAASAVASGMVPVAHGGDGGGSIRIPASCCGLFGLKPTRGRVTMAPYMGEAWGGFVQEHVLARSVRDSALLLDIEDVPTPGEPYAAPHKPRSWVQELKKKPAKLKIAYTAEALYGDETDADCRAALEDTVTLLRELGHEVVEARPKFDREAMVRAYFLTVATGVAWFVESTSAAAGRKPRAKDYELGTWLLALIGWATKAPDLLDAQITMQRNARDVAELFESHDVFLTPTLARAPAKVGQLQVQPSEALQLRALKRLPLKALLDFALEQMGKNKLSWTPNTQLFNQTGQPGMSVPLYTNADGLPIGSQFVGRFGDEATLFRLAAQLEKARPWKIAVG